MRQSPRPQRSLAGSHVTRVCSADDELVSRASDLQCRPTVLDNSSSRRLPNYHIAVRNNMLQSVSRSPFAVAQTDGFAVGGNPTLESLYFANVAPPSPELLDHSTSPITVMSKPRAFPRTNPAYIGSRGRDGMRPSYRKIDTELLRAPVMSSARARRVTDDVRHEPVCAEKRHERSDSDTSHSSFGINRLQQCDTTQGFLNMSADHKVVNNRDAFSDSHLVSADSLSSRGSSRVYVNSASGGMTSSPHDSLSSKDSPLRIADPDPRRYQLALHLTSDQQSQSAHNTPTARVRVRRNSEPDYANLPIVTPFQTSTVIDSCSNKDRRVGQRSGETMQSGDSLSPKHHGTPNSRRSASTHNSSASNTSEGEHASCT